mmetsp:Transcript_3476/g.10484  ORF Transcript_3476/g.10484 Transcript_3476/m.10484 type:complete len:101 (+) Transcript_3476:707-1009(+)
MYNTPRRWCDHLGLKQAANGKYNVVKMFGLQLVTSFIFPSNVISCCSAENNFIYDASEAGQFSNPAYKAKVCACHFEVPRVLYPCAQHRKRKWRNHLEKK